MNNNAIPDVNALNSRKHYLESLELQKPGIDLKPDWLELAKQYEKTESRINYHYCMLKAGEIVPAKPIPPIRPPAQETFDWQERKDVQ